MMDKTCNMLLYLAITLLCVVQPSDQTVYTCDPNIPCGCSKDTVTVSKIVGGENASSAAWGWVVSLKLGSGGLCGGSIIGSTWVLTAAHCTYGRSASSITVYAGSNTRWFGRQIRSVSKIINHPSYDPSTYEDDIALLQLSSPLNFSDPYVSMICLPSIIQATLAADEWPSVGTNLVAVGWGTLSEGGSFPTTLQQVTVQAVAYNASTCTPVMVDWHAQFCAGVSGGGKDTCQGDSGGPLMLFNSSNVWVLVGATSSGIGCAQAENSGMYTRIANYQEWIEINTEPSYTTSISTTYTTDPRTTTRIRITITTGSSMFSFGRRTESSLINLLLFVTLIVASAFGY